MDDLDTLFSRVEDLDLPPGIRDAHLARITAATNRGLRHPKRAAALGEPPAHRRHAGSAMVLTGAAVVAIMGGAWFLANTEHPMSQAPMSQAASTPAPSTTTPRTLVSAPDAPNLLTAAGSAALLGDILHISPAAAEAGLARLADMASPATGLDPTTAQFGAVAKALGTTSSGLEQALADLKARSGGVSAKPVRTEVVASTGSASGTNLLTGSTTVTQLADILHVSSSAASNALAQLAALVGHDGSLDSTNPQFGKIAAALGTTPAALDGALSRIKASAVGSPSSAKGSKPATPNTARAGDGDQLTAPATADRLATLLHVSIGSAKGGLTKLAQLAAQTSGGLDPTTAQFREIAIEIGTTPGALSDALRHIKTGQ
jgi:hypothetical protein